MVQVSGGIGSRIAGGSFWDGFRSGAIAAGLNHAAHRIAFRGPDTNPYEEYFANKSVEIEQYLLENSRLTWRTPLGLGLVLSGTRLDFLKPVGALGSARGSTLLSYTLGKTFKGNIFSTFGKNSITQKLVAKTGTAVVGRVGGRILSRVVPYVGWGMFAADIGSYFYSAYTDLRNGALSNPNYYKGPAIDWALKYGERE